MLRPLGFLRFARNDRIARPISSTGVSKVSSRRKRQNIDTQYRITENFSESRWEEAIVDLFGRQWTRSAIERRVGHISQLGGVRLLTSDNGPSRGVRLIQFSTGTGFTFEVALDRGMDVGRAEYRGASLAWMPPTLMAGPWFFEQQTEFGWLRTALGGLNNTCGLIHIGNPETADVRHYNFPARPEERYGVHDRAAMIPAELVSLGERWEGDSLILEAVGRVTQAQAYGENLAMIRTYRAELGRSAFVMEDVIENRGFVPVEHMLLYHFNIGFPFVDAGAELIAPFASRPRLLFGEADLDNPTSWASFTAPTANFIQQTFEHEMAADGDGRVHVAIVNPLVGDGAAVAISYDKRVMPRFIEWRMMAEGQYAVGLEPCTNGFGRDAVKANGELIVLEPGDRRTYRTELSVVEGAAAIERFRDKVASVSPGKFVNAQGLDSIG
jgi:hypothetical protein